MYLSKLQNIFVQTTVLNSLLHGDGHVHLKDTLCVHLQHSRKLENNIYTWV